MSEIVQRKIIIKTRDKPLRGGELDKFAASKHFNVSKFSKNTVLLGVVIFGKKLYGTIGVEKERWADTKSYNPNYDMIDRITIKLFERSGKIIGKIEERLIKELSISSMSGKLPVFSAALRNFPYFIDLERESDRLAFAMITDKRKKMLEIFIMSKKSFAIRSNFTVKRKFWDQRVALINSKRGGKIEITITDEELAQNANFYNFLILFAATMKFHDDISNKIHAVIKELEASMLIIKPSKKALSQISTPPKMKLSETDEETLIILREKVEAEVSGRAIMPEIVREEVAEEKPEMKKAKKKKKPKKGIKVEELPEPPKRKTPPRKKGVEKVLKEAPALTITKKEIEKPLYLEDSILEVTGMTEDASLLLEKMGIFIVDDLLFVDPTVIAENLGIASIDATKIKDWQITSEKRLELTIRREKERRDRYIKKHEDREKQEETHF